jgi:hypothetical protein
VDWNEVPDLLLIDGIAVPTKEVSGKLLTVTGGRHTILSLRSNSIAWAQTTSASHDVTVHAHLEFKPFPPADKTSIEGARQKRQWLEVLARTTDGNLQPRDPALSLIHFEALHRLELDHYIQVKDWNLLPKEDWAKVNHWQRSREPLSSWY